MGMDAGKGGEVVLQQLIGTYDEVALFVALNVHICHFEVAVYIGRETIAHGDNLQGVHDGYRVEHGLQVVVSVRTFLHYVQA